MYTATDYRTKKALKEAVAAGERVKIYQPGGFFPDPDFTVKREHAVEGPHYPKPHSWYATVTTDETGHIIKVK